MNKFHLTTATKGEILSNIQEDRREEQTVGSRYNNSPKGTIIVTERVLALLMTFTISPLPADMCCLCVYYVYIYRYVL